MIAKFIDIHYFDSQGVYAATVQGDAGASAPPDNGTYAPLPTDIPAGQAPVVNAAKDGWILVEDHRGEIVYRKDLSGEMLIETVGVIPEGFTRQPPPEWRSGYFPRFSDVDDAWEYTEDHRGKAGYVDGEYAVITELGPLPESWTLTPPEPPDTRTAEQKTEDAIRLEADPLAQAALRNRAEAEALRLTGDNEGAAAADARANALLLEFLTKKDEIYARYQDREDSTEPTDIKEIS